MKLGFLPMVGYTSFRFHYFTLRASFSLREGSYTLYSLLVVFIWRYECKESFNKLKVTLSTKPILKAYNWKPIFHVHVDASNFAIGAILAQPREGKMDFPICYAARQFNNVEKNYITIEREGLGMVYAIKKFCHYLLASKFIFFVDHQALLYLVNKPCSTRRIVHWFLILLEFDFTLVVNKRDYTSKGRPPI